MMGVASMMEPRLMSLRILLAAGAAFALAATASAKHKDKHKEKHVEHSRTCVCTMSGPGQSGVMVAPVPPIPPVPAVLAVPPQAMWHFGPHHSGGPFCAFSGGDGEDRVVVIRKGKRFRDSADRDGDGEVTRREFMKRAEKHFEERDRDGDGKLDEGEQMPMPFTIPLPPPPHTPAPPPPPEE
jgi:hypothetical protein